MIYNCHSEVGRGLSLCFARPLSLTWLTMASSFPAGALCRRRGVLLPWRKMILKIPTLECLGAHCTQRRLHIRNVMGFENKEWLCLELNNGTLIKKKWISMIIDVLFTSVFLCGGSCHPVYWCTIARVNDKWIPSPNFLSFRPTEKLASVGFQVPIPLNWHTVHTV